ncbi:MAG: lipopolysaccharide heptosyltransferase I [Burkholderiales bacterium]
MRKILIVKTSSLGDIVHNFPAISDIRRNLPNASIDWVVEEAYESLAKLHPAIRRAIPVAVRRWRGRPLKRETWAEVGVLHRLFKSEQYDEIIDTQGLVKSAVLASVARGRRHGFDATSARERIAARFYDVRHHVARAQHAVQRNRDLVAHALGYRIEGLVDYGLNARVDDAKADPYIVFLHSTSRADKQWNESNWIQLGGMIEAAGRRVVLPWGNDSERQRSERIASALHMAIVPDAMSVEAAATMLANSSGIAGLDTGLTHLAAALNKPVAAIYCATDPRLTGVFGASRARNLGGVNQVPKPAEVFDALREHGAL